jgi:antitoxin (DNA-binding transcriptional repressor) of toxin-antitoxin stability system
MNRTTHKEIKMSVTVAVQEQRLAQLLTYINRGEEIVLTQEGKPIAHVIPIKGQRAERIPGSAIGEIIIMPDFDDPLPDDVLALFEQ